MLTGRILQENGRDNIECYGPGTNGNLPVGTLPCAGEGGRYLGLYWALPCSTNGVTVTEFDYQLAVAGVTTKPRADAVKVIVIEDVKNGGSYKKALVPDTYEVSDFVAACCAGCDPIEDVTVPAPFIFNGFCVPQAPTFPACVTNGAIFVDALVSPNNTFTATPFGYTSTGALITFSPATATGTSVALLAAAMQTAWATEMGSGTFTATGNVITFTSTNGATLAFSIAQSQV